MSKKFNITSIKDKIFSFVRGNKKKTIATALFFALGAFAGAGSTISQEEYNSNLAAITSINQKISSYEAQHNNLEGEISKLSLQEDELSKQSSTLSSQITTLKSNIKTEETRIVAEKEAKAEADRLIAEKAEAERLAAEKAEAERLGAIASQNNSYTSSGNSYASSDNGYTSSNNGYVASVDENNIGAMVWITANGSKYHSHGNCGRSKYVSQVTRSEAESRGLGPCSKCY